MRVGQNTVLRVGRPAGIGRGEGGHATFLSSGFWTRVARLALGHGAASLDPAPEGKVDGPRPPG